MYKFFKLLMVIAALALSFETAAIPVLQAANVSNNIDNTGFNGDIQDVSLSPALAAVISCLVPGLGQMMLGKKTRGFYFLAALVVLWVVAAATLGIGGICIIPLSIWAAVDAYNIAKAKGGDDIDDEEDDDSMIDIGVTPVFLR